MPPPAQSVDAFCSCTFLNAILCNYEYIIRRTKGWGGGGTGPQCPPPPPPTLDPPLHYGPSMSATALWAIYVHHCTMDHLWTIYGPSMDHLCPPLHYGPSMDHLWTIYVHHCTMDHLCPLWAIYAHYGPSMDHLWTIYGPSMDHLCPLWAIHALMAGV